ncbi:MAG TPA: hypothetical protein VG815_01470 [Chloroflexota bacterium]|jgi:hypothetical protein|nr:hypothetical protein [Chloroflexota bacterium]
MAKRKATITVDPEILATARDLTGAASAQAIDIALGRIVATERLRHDIEAYTQIPTTADEILLGTCPVVLDLDDADVNYDALYGEV